MNAFTSGGIDCDIHPGVPSVKVLLPYMDSYWADAFVQRGMDGFDMASYPPGAPLPTRISKALSGPIPAVSRGTEDSISGPESRTPTARP